MESLFTQPCAGIARGAGVHPICIREVLEVFKPFQKAAAGMKKMNLPIGKNGDISKMAVRFSFRPQTIMLCNTRFE